MICWTCQEHYIEGFSECACPVCHGCGCKFEEDPDHPYWHLCPDCDDETETDAEEDAWGDHFVFNDPPQVVCSERKHGDAQLPLF